VPSYATDACSKGNLYGSACSCWGITDVVSTALTPTMIVTVTAMEIGPGPAPQYDCTNPSIGNSLKYIDDDSCGSEGRCTCSYNLKDEAVCLEDVDCETDTTCDSDDDCDEDDEICWIYSSCDKNLCAKLSEVCHKTGSTRLMLQGGQEAQPLRVKPCGN
jgi:hypothetical protein